MRLLAPYQTGLWLAEYLDIRCQLCRVYRSTPQSQLSQNYLLSNIRSLPAADSIQHSLNPLPNNPSFLLICASNLTTVLTADYFAHIVMTVSRGCRNPSMLILLLVRFYLSKRRLIMSIRCVKRSELLSIMKT